MSSGDKAPNPGIDSGIERGPIDPEQGFHLRVFADGVLRSAAPLGTPPERVKPGQFLIVYQDEEVTSAHGVIHHPTTGQSLDVRVDRYRDGRPIEYYFAATAHEAQGELQPGTSHWEILRYGSDMYTLRGYPLRESSTPVLTTQELVQALGPQ